VIIADAGAGAQTGPGLYFAQRALQMFTRIPRERTFILAETDLFDAAQWRRGVRLDKAITILVI
jgi:hypothetical protein